MTLGKHSLNVASKAILPAMAAAVLAACVASAPATTTQPAATPAGATPAPGVTTAAPGSVATPVAQASPAASPQPTAGLGLGKSLKPYNFKGFGGLYYEFTQNLLYVVDGESNDETPRRFVFRKFKLDGTFDSMIPLNPEGKEAPDAVDGVAFDRSGIPYYTYLDDTTNIRKQEFRLLKLITATVVEPNKMPSHYLERAGKSALQADGNVITLAVRRLDPDTEEQIGGDILYARAEEAEPPEALFDVPDPFFPTVHMAFASGGNLFIAGPNRTSGFGIKRLSRDQKLTDVSFAIPTLPDGMWISPKDELFTVNGSTSNAAVARRFKLDGTALGVGPLELANGGYLTSVAGMTFTPKGQVIMAASGFDADKKVITGLFSFDLEGAR